MLRIVCCFILASVAAISAPIDKTVTCTNAGGIDVGKNPQRYDLSVMFTSPVDNPTRIFTRYANTKNKDFLVEKMTGPFDGCFFGTITQPSADELLHTVTISDAGNKSISKGDKISFVLHASAPPGSMFETRDTDPSTPSKDFRIAGKVDGRDVRIDIPLKDVTFKVAEVPEPGTWLTLLSALTLLSLQRLSNRISPISWGSK